MNGSLKNLKAFRSPFVEVGEGDGDYLAPLHSCINKIMGTLSFRKLAGKTQVILSINGPDVRTRLTHTMEVAKIARDLCRELGLNAELAEAIALAHDIGHTPFGHVGERTLKDIMCGCNRLDGKVPDNDFRNTGFKHNLQSFRVLMKDLGHLDDQIWPYIYWGVLNHTKMTYAKPSAGNLDNDIFISIFLCKQIYNCYFHSSHQCRRNAINPILSEERLCKPWYCAILAGDDGKLPRGKVKHLSCEEKCYMAKLWKAKIDKRDMFSDLRFLFDHPFPNIFYADFLSEYFLKKHNEWVSLEAFIVSQADEIAQRRQDLEDAINKGLLKIEAAKHAVKELIRPFSQESELESISEEIDKRSTTHELGEIVANFYHSLLINSTMSNIIDFVDDTKKIDINVYSLLDTIYRRFIKDPCERREWIITELRAHTDGMIYFKENLYFEWKSSISAPEVRRELYSIAFELLEFGSKLALSIGNKLSSTSYEYDHEMLGILIDAINKDIAYFQSKNQDCGLISKYNLEDKISFLRALDDIHRCIKVRPKPKPVKLKLFHYYVINSIYGFFNNTDNRNRFTAINFIDVLHKFSGLEEDYEKKRSRFFHDWKKIFGIEGHRILHGLVSFIDIKEANDKQQEQEKALHAFEDSQKNTIIKSEIVEKNDGKANYILRRLFKAYLTNPHQLPDSALGWILKGIEEEYELLRRDEISTISSILNSLKSSLFMSDREKERVVASIIRSLSDVASTREEHREGSLKDLESNLSNEIKAILKEDCKLRSFFDAIQDRIDTSDIDMEDKESQRSLRRILDNPILGAIPMWKSILIRGICDHIAGLTDLEAINEYEKLYTGVMELV